MASGESQSKEGQDGLLSLYQTMTNLFTLYNRAQEFEHREEAKEVWSELSDNLLVEVGEFYQLWSMSSEAHAGIANEEALNQSCEIIEKRMRRSLDLITPWVSHAKLPHIFDLFERKIRKLLQNLLDHVDVIAPIIYARIEQSKERQHLLRKLDEVYNYERRKIG